MEQLEEDEEEREGINVLSGRQHAKRVELISCEKRVKASDLGERGGFWWLRRFLMAVRSDKR
jgi:hypothetical protein